eukprot:scaffold10302_cov45-Phaeocystis_antarctica.AAC.1
MAAQTHTGTLRPRPLSRGSLSRALSGRANGLNSLAHAKEPARHSRKAPSLLAAEACCPAG